jgi:hypothetical protein
MSGKRASGEGSIYPYKNGFAAYVWVTTPDGDRKRKYVYGKTREETHEKWIKLHGEASKGPVQTRHRTVAAFLSYWLESIVKPNLAPLSYVSYEGSVRLYIVPHLGCKRLKEADRPGRAGVADQAGRHLPVLCSGKGRQAPQGAAAMLCRRGVLRGVLLPQGRPGGA